MARGWEACWSRHCICAPLTFPHLAHPTTLLHTPAVAVYLLGKGGAFLMVLQLFMAVTASGSAEQMAVSSLVAYDVFKTYIKPDATGKQVCGCLSPCP